MKKHMQKAYSKLAKFSPTLYYLIQYRRASNKLGNMAESRNKLFSDFIATSRDEKCLQIGVKDSVGSKYGPNWVSADKYDTRDFIDHNCDILDLQFENESFGAVACISILEHIAQPELAIKELYRVLKPGGHIWIQVPLQFPYHEAPKDYWRVTPDGLRLWMHGFSEIECANFVWSRSALATATYFYGTKP